MSFTRHEDFDTTSKNIAEGIDEIMQAQRSRARRLALIQRQVRHAMNVAFKAGLRRAAADSDQRAEERDQKRMKPADDESDGLRIEGVKAAPAIDR